MSDTPDAPATSTAAPAAAPVSLADARRWLQARWPTLLVVTLLVAAATVALILRAPGVYTAKAVVRIDRSSYSLYPTTDEALTYVLSDAFQKQVAVAARARPGAAQTPPVILPRLVPGPAGGPTSFLELTARASKPTDAVTLAQVAASTFMAGTRVPAVAASRRWAAHLERLEARRAARRRALTDAVAVLASATVEGRSTSERLLADSRIGRIEQEVQLLEDRILEARVAFDDARTREETEKARRSRVVSVDAQATTSAPGTGMGLVRAVALGLMAGFVVALGVAAAPGVWRRLSRR